MDELVFASLAQVPILVVPVGNITQSTFEKWAQEVCKFEEIRLGDIPSTSKDERARFMPSPLASGSLNLSYVSRPPPHYRYQTTLFRPSTFPLGIVGISCCSQASELHTIQTQFKTLIAGLFPVGAIYPLARSCFVFEDGGGSTALDIGKSLPDLYIIPSMMGNKQIYIGTLLSELCSTILGDFSTITQMLETPIGNDSLNTSLFGDLPGTGDLVPPTEMLDSKTSSQPILSSQQTHTDLANALQTRDLSLKRSSTLGPGSMPTRNSTLIQSTQKRRASGMGSTASAGRLYKVLGDLFLLAGRTMDASIWFTEAIVLLKQSQDYLWHGSALEGIATALIIDAFNASHTSSTPKEPWAEVMEKMTQAISLYQKVATTFADEDLNAGMAHIYTSCVIKSATALFCIWAARGWGPRAFSAMLHPSAFRQIILEVSGISTEPSKIDELSTISRVTRGDVSSILAQAQGPWILHLGSRDRIEILRSMARLYAAMNFRRKESYVIRELVGCIMDIFVCGREERPPLLTPSLDNLPDGAQGETKGGDIGLRESEDGTGNESVLQLMRRLCEALGIDLNVVQFAKVGKDEGPILPDHFKETNSVLDGYGWPPLQTVVVQEMLFAAEALPDYPSVIIYGLSVLKSMRMVLDADTQYRLFTTCARAMTTTRRRGVPMEVEFWPGNLLSEISMTPLHFTRAPIDVKVPSASSTNAVGNSAAVDPFLYNPRRVSSAKQRSRVVQNEELEFMVELFNPYFVTLELQHISLSASGVAFECTPSHAILPANTSQSVILKGRAKEQGTLVIRGCFMQLPGTVKREVVLPLLKDDEKERQQRRLSSITSSKERLKSKGLHGWLRRDSTHPSPLLSQIRFVELKVVPEQPFLRIRRTSLTHGAVMLYEGEMVTIRLTLENVSSIPVDLMQLNVNDSTKDAASAALAEGNLSDHDVYEIEYELVQKPVLVPESDLSGKEVGPGEEAVVALKCFGRAGCINGLIQISYANTQSNNEENPDTIYGRQLVYPVLITVYQMLECQALNISSLTSINTQGDLNGSSWRKTFQGTTTEEWCLLSVHVLNSYNLPFEVTLSYKTDVDNTSNFQLIPPGSTQRLIIPVRRFLLPQAEITAPIPSLTNRQFVLTEQKSGGDALQREIFWYREYLFRHIHLGWKESGGIRCGEMSLRHQRITQPMLQALRIDSIQVRLELVEDDTVDDHVLVKRLDPFGTSFTTQSNRLVCLKATLKNSTDSSKIVSLSLGVDPSEHVLSDGVLGSIPLGRLQSQEATVFEIGLSFISEGSFNIQSQAYILEDSGRLTVAGTGSISVRVEDGIVD